MHAPVIAYCFKEAKMRAVRALLVLSALSRVGSNPIDLIVHPLGENARWSSLGRTGTATERLSSTEGEVHAVANGTQGYFYLQYAKNSTTNSSVMKEVIEVSNAGHGMTVVSDAH